MLTESSITITPPEPPIVPQAARVSKSMGMSSTVSVREVPSLFFSVKVSPNLRIFAEEPPGITALNVRPGNGPPQTSLSSSPSVILPTSYS